MQRSISNPRSIAVALPRGWILLFLTSSSWALLALMWISAVQIWTLF